MLDNLHLVPARSVIVVDVPASVATEPTIAFGRAGATLQLNVATENGLSYQLQSATTLTGQPSDGSNEGAAAVGDGTTKSFDQAIAPTGDKYFRIRVY